jgi:hypothetical protein
VSYLSQVVDGYQPDYFDELAKRISAWPTGVNNV